MGFIAIFCPRTGREVSTGIESDRDGFDRLRPMIVRMKCPACGSEHVWSKATARLVEQGGGSVAGLAFVLELTFLNGRQKLNGYDVFSLLQYDK